VLRLGASDALLGFSQLLKRHSPLLLLLLLHFVLQVAGGAFYFAGGTGMIKNCTFIGPISNTKNDIYNKGGEVTFACADDEVGTPVQMQGTEITVIPPKELQCVAAKYSCDALTGSCNLDQDGSFPSKQACSSGCTATPTPAPCQVPRNCGDLNDTTVCGYKFKGCEFTCDFCCEPYFTGINCDPCTEAKCKPLPPLPPPVTTKYACITTPEYHCVEFPGGTFHTPTDCENDCKKAPAPSSTQTSTDLE
jgi:hypothetical protein